MKKKLFDGKLYLEGLRQTKVMGIALALITIFGSAVHPLVKIMDYLQLKDMEKSAAELLQYVTQLELSGFTPLLAIFMFLAPILFTLSLFGFLNKRNSSDFYHALPCTRTCLFLSFSASIVTWLAGTMLITVLLTGVLYSVNPITTMSWTFVPYNFFTYFTGALLVMAVMLLAKSMTGTVFNNIIVAGIIGYLPRLICYLFDYLLVSMVPVIEEGSLGIFSDFSYNIPVNFSLGFALITTSDFSFIGGMLYTFMLAIIYFVGALLIFQRRKSETAQRSATSKWMQHVFRCLITIPVTFLVCIASTFFEFLVVLLISLLVYLGYELITTKKVKNLLKALPAFLGVIAFDVVFIVALVLTRNVLLADVPNASQIESVYVNLNSSYYSDHYNQLLVKDYYVVDTTLEESISAALQDTVDAVKKDTYDKKLQQSGTYSSCEVSIQKSNGTVLKRNILLTQEQIDYAIQVYEKEETYQKKLVQLPEFSEVESVYADSNYVEEPAAFWEIFSREYEALSQTEKLKINGLGLNTDKYGTPITEESAGRTITISVYGYMGVNSYAVDYEIDKANFPEAYTWCLNFMNANAEQIIDTFWEEVNDGKEADYGYEIWFGSTDAIGGNTYTCFVGNEDVIYWTDVIEVFSTLPEALNILQGVKPGEVTVTEPIYELIVRKNVLLEDGWSYEESSATIYFNLAPEEYEILKPYLTEDGQS